MTSTACRPRTMRQRGAAVRRSRRFDATSRRPGSSPSSATAGLSSVPIRIGAVGYLNARPLTWALDGHPDRWSIRYDVPSVCSSLLHAGQVDLGLVPSIDYLQDPHYRFVPGVGIGSRGAIASVALYTRVPIDRISAIAL